MSIEVGYFGTYLVYLGLLSAILLLLFTKKKVLAPIGEDLFESYNKIATQDILVLFFLITIVGLRYNVGVDWPAYKEYFEGFNLYKNLTFQDQNMELGYYLINYLVSYVGGSYTLIFSIAAAISWVFILKSYPSKLLPLTIFFIFCDGYFFWSLNGVRQFIAVAIFAYSIKYIINKNFLYFILFITFASLFHYSAILLTPLYFLPYHRLYNQKWWTIAFTVSFIFAGTPLILKGLPIIFRSVSEFVPFLAGYNSYFESKYYEAVELPGIGLGYFFRILISFVFLIFSKPLLRKYPKTQIYFILFFIGIIIYNLFFTLQIVGRFTNYFLFLRAYLLGVLVYFFLKNKNFNYIGMGIIILYFVLLWVDILDSANSCCPYQFTF